MFIQSGRGSQGGLESGLGARRWGSRWLHHPNPSVTRSSPPTAGSRVRWSLTRAKPTSFVTATSAAACGSTPTYLNDSYRRGRMTLKRSRFSGTANRIGAPPRLSTIRTALTRFDPSTRRFLPLPDPKPHESDRKILGMCCRGVGPAACIRGGQAAFRRRGRQRPHTEPLHSMDDAAGRSRRAGFPRSGGRRAS